MSEAISGDDGLKAVTEEVFPRKRRWLEQRGVGAVELESPDTVAL